jgi:hypothetical protein
MYREPEDIKWPLYDIPSHREAVGRIIRSRPSGAVDDELAPKKLPFMYMHSKASIVIWLVIGVIAVASISTALVFAAQSIGNRNLSTEELREIVLAKTEGLIKNVDDAEEAPQQETENDKTFYLKNSSDERIGWAHVNKKTGEVTGIYNSSIMPSSDAKIDLLRAKSLAEDFLKSQGVDVEALVLDKAELRVAAEVGFPDNPTKLYIYYLEFYPQVNGIPVDDFAYGTGPLSIRLSAEDGSINEYIGRLLPVSLPEPSSDFKIDKSKAINIAIERVKEQRQNTSSPTDGKEIRYSVNEDEVEMRYMLVSDSEMKPYWRLTVEGDSINANRSLMGIGAENGEVLLEALAI